jgi:formiminotetrahydrofolate cyclodeaminase
MKLTALDLSGFAGRIASGSPTPGGGSASAFAGAMGAALTEMVAGLTSGRKKYAEFEELMCEILEETSSYREDLLNLADKDSSSYDGFVAATKMPKETESEIEARKEAMQSALTSATAIPLDVMNISVSALRAAHKAIGKSNKNAVTDLGVAVLLLGAAVKGAWLNVRTNLVNIQDHVYKEEVTDIGVALSAEAEKLVSEIMGDVEKEFASG